MRPIRILQVLNRLEYGSGACAVMMNYYEHMDQQKIVFDFLVHGETEQELRTKLESRGSKIYQMPPLRVRNLFLYKKALNQFFQMHPEYMVIHGNLPNAAVFYLDAAQKAGVPVRILHAHSADSSGHLRKKMRNFLLGRAGVRYANVYFSCSKKAALYTYGKNAVCAWIVKNAIDVRRFRFDEKKRLECRKKYGIKNEMVLGHVGRLSEEKNQMFLLEILYAAKKRGILCKLLFVGDGEMKERIVLRAAELGIQDSVIYAGMTQKVEWYLAAMDLFLLPSHFEGLPLAGIEAQCSGLPCLFSDTVTKEAKILDTTVFLPINNVNLWVEEAVRMSGMRNERAWTHVQKRGYDIEREAEKLEHYYIRRAADRKRVSL